MTGTGPGEGIATTHHEMARATHIARDQDGLARLSENRIQLFATWTKGTRGPFAMDEDCDVFAVLGVGFKFSNIVTHIVE